MEEYGRLVAPTVFNTVVVEDLGQGGSIPLRLRHLPTNLPARVSG